ARKARGKTQEEVADFLECSRPTYIAIEKGDRAAKSDEIIKLASFLGRKVNELVRPTAPVVDLQPHLRAAAEKMKGADEEAKNAGMYAYTADLGCCILVNRKHPPERRRVSILHEYGHLIVDRYKPGIDYLAMTGRKPANERFAESFGLCFLMPASSVRQRFHD